MGKMYKLTDVCDFQGGTQPPKNEWILSEKDDYIRMLQIRDFTQNNVKNEYVKDSDKLKKCKSDDILIARYGASVGKILTGLTGAYNVAIMKTIPSNEVIKRYLLFYLKSSYFQHKIRNVGSRAAQAGFNKADLSTFDIFLPTIETQQKIADTLDLASELIGKRKEQIAEMDKLIQSVFYEMFGKYIKSKEFISLGSIANHISSGATPNGGSLAYKKEGIRFIRSQNVLMNSIDYTNIVYISEETHNKMKRSKLQKNDILLNITGASIGRVATYNGNDDEANTNQHVAAIRLDTNDFNSFFVSYFLASNYQQAIIKNISSGGTREALNYQQIKNFQIPKVDIVLQNKFASIVEEIESQKKVMEESLHEMKNNFNGLIQKAFRGELFPEE